MKKIALLGMLCVFAGVASAQIIGDMGKPQPSCTAQATSKKLAGAALNRFIEKCKSDAVKACDTFAKSKKLVGAAKTSFINRCVKNAVSFPQPEPPP